MSVTKSRWMKRLGIGTVALLGLGAVSLQSTPADAHLFFSVGPSYGYGYGYGYAPYYPYPAYYGYAPYYGYSGYGYPYGGVTFAFGGGHHHHWR